MKILKIFIVGIMPLLASSCGVFIEKDISNESVVLLSPGDGTRNDETTQRFSWEDNEQIDQYRLQIVTSSFSDLRVTYHDTLLTSTSFSTDDLSAQPYQWRVRGESSSDNTTDYERRSFVVDLIKDIRTETVQLLTPVEGKDDYALGTSSIRLNWEALEGATTYDLVVLPNDPTTYSTSDPLFTDVTTTNELITTEDALHVDNDESIDEDDSDTYDPVDILYTWYVIGKNDEFQSQKSEIRTFSVKTRVRKNN